MLVDVLWEEEGGMSFHIHYPLSPPETRGMTSRRREGLFKFHNYKNFIIFN